MVRIVHMFGAKGGLHRYAVGRYQLTDSALPDQPLVEVWQEPGRWTRIWPPLRGQPPHRGTIAAKIIALAAKHR